MVRGTGQAMSLDRSALTIVIQERVHHVGSADSRARSLAGKDAGGRGVKTESDRTPAHEAKHRGEEQRPGLQCVRSRHLAGSAAPTSLWLEKSCHVPGNFNGPSTSFHLPLDLQFYQIVHCILMFGFLPSSLPPPSNPLMIRKASGVWCKLNFLSGVEMQIIPSKIIQILLRFLVLRCCR